MPSFPLHGGQLSEAAGADTSASRGTLTTSGGSANTKSSSWTQLIASTAFNASAISIRFDSIPQFTDQLVDIAIGASGSEVVLLSNLNVSSGRGQVVYGTTYLFPIKIPKGSRLSVKNQSTAASNALYVSVKLFAQGFIAGQPLTKVTPYGVNTATSGGVSIDPGGTTNTKGAYTQITASTTYPIRCLTIALGNQANSVRTSCNWLMDIAIGAGGSEKVIFNDIALFCSSSPDTVIPQVFNLISITIPSGSRIAVRSQCDITDATDRLFDVMLYGVC